MELGQLGDEHTHQGHSVEDEMDLVVFSIEAGEEVPGGKVQERDKVLFERFLPPSPPMGRSKFPTTGKLWQGTSEQK